MPTIISLSTQRRPPRSNLVDPATAARSHICLNLFHRSNLVGIQAHGVAIRSRLVCDGGLMLNTRHPGRDPKCRIPLGSDGFGLPGRNRDHVGSMLCSHGARARTGGEMTGACGRRVWVLCAFLFCRCPNIVGEAGVETLQVRPDRNVR